MLHLQIYKAFPDVQSVVHSHTNEVLPFAAARIPLTAQMHTVRFCTINIIFTNGDLL